MNFNKAFPNAKIDEQVGRLQKTERIYPCFVCGTRTGWRDVKNEDNFPTPICSDECLDKSDQNSEEAERETALSVRPQGQGETLPPVPTSGTTEEAQSKPEEHREGSLDSESKRTDEASTGPSQNNVGG